MTGTRVKIIDGDEYLSQPELAERRSVHPETICNWRKHLGLPARRVGGRWYYATAMVREWEHKRSGQ
jgi:DNA-binding transcriptional regulator YiaG